MRLAIVAIAATFIAAVFSSCEGDGGPSVSLLLEADLSQLPAEADRDARMNSAADIMERRAIAFGATAVDVERREPNRIYVTLSGVISEEDARQLIERTAQMELRQPVLSENGQIVCETDDSTFSIPAEQVVYAPAVPNGPLLPQCGKAGERTGAIVWEPASGGESQTGAETIALIQPSGATVDRSGSPAVVATFTLDSAQILRETSERLVGLPLGIFVDGELLAAPTVKEPITTNTLVIAGLSLPSANILAAQLDAGALPVPLRVISVEGPP